MPRVQEAELDLSGEVLDDSTQTTMLKAREAQAAMANALTGAGWTVIPPAEKSWYASKPKKVAEGKEPPTFLRMLAAHAARAAVNKGVGGGDTTGGLTDEEVAEAVGISAHTATARSAELNTLGLLTYVVDQNGRKSRRAKYAVRTITDLGRAVLAHQMPDEDSED